MVTVPLPILFQHLLKKVLNDETDILNNEIIYKSFISKYDKIKNIIIKSQSSNTPLLLISNSIIFFELITQKVGTGNLIQAQRDFFGSHGFNLIDSKRLLKNNWHK